MKRVIEKYRKMMEKYGEMDIWQDDIEPRLEAMTIDEIKNQYEKDKEYYSNRIVG